MNYQGKQYENNKYMFTSDFRTSFSIGGVIPDPAQSSKLNFKAKLMCVGITNKKHETFKKDLKNLTN